MAKVVAELLDIVPLVVEASLVAEVANQVAGVRAVVDIKALIQGELEDRVLGNNLLGC